MMPGTALFDWIRPDEAGHDAGEYSRHTPRTCLVSETARSLTVTECHGVRRSVATSLRRGDIKRPLFSFTIRSPVARCGPAQAGAVPTEY